MSAPDPRPNTALVSTAQQFEAMFPTTDVPLYDQTQPIKNWLCTDLAGVAPGTPVAVYNLGYVDANGNPTTQAAGKPGVVKTMMPAGYLSTPNIGAFFSVGSPFPGWSDYVAALPPTKNTFTFAAFPNLPAQSIAPASQVTLVTAQRLCQEIVLDLSAMSPSLAVTATPELVQQQSGVIYNYVDADGNGVYQILLAGAVTGSWDASKLLQQRFASGEWCPGTFSWDPTLGPADGPQFKAETFPAMPTNTATIPVPIDPKYADTTQWQVVVGLLGVLEVQPVGATPAPTPASGAVDLTPVLDAVAELRATVVKGFNGSGLEPPLT